MKAMFALFAVGLLAGACGYYCEKKDWVVPALVFYVVGITGMVNVLFPRGYR